ncbi:hypothetical protein [Streptomyces physcomitrii]|uniref:Uncharacterized protein n=1 Tax=Streptomyces physcomitrii TaxID=2724184 RepID=A0ABX1H9S8_9ACTN|nr:hypothetical protein [Streptomyces physcomitrii]NKI45095.1 hypothetical protein [Streptomyces physcomitrii]
MTTFVITVPGTFLKELTGPARAELLRGLRPRDPQRTELGAEEDLDILTVREGGTFSLHLEVEAENAHAAETAAKELAARALADIGFTEEEAPLGPTAVTGIDNDA